jgi:phosphate transport system ATP-binding protein
VTRAKPKAHRAISAEPASNKIEVQDLSAGFGDKTVLRSISMPIEDKRVTAIIGPSGCGKSTFIRCLNRMHELSPIARLSGRILLDGRDINDKGVDPVLLRRRVGMVFQKPNPFPTMSIKDNVLAGLRLTASLRRSTRAAACRAASSSGSASPAPWRSTRRCS